MPFITEEVYQTHFKKHEKEISIHLSKWPEQDKKLTDKKLERAGDKAMEIISEVRKFKSNQQKSLKTEINLTLDEKDKKNLEPFLEDLKAVTFAKKISFGKFNILF